MRSVADVFFSQVPPSRPGSKTDKLTVILWPSSSQERDLRFHARFDFVVEERQKGLSKGTLRLAFLPDGTRALDVVEKLGNQGLVPADEVPKYFSLQVDINGYQQLLDDVGPNLTRKVLSALRDVAIAGNAGWASRARATRAFVVGVLRTPEAFFAYENATDVVAGIKTLHGIEPPNEMTVRGRFGDHSRDTVATFRFQIGGPAESRICAMIGENGVGKSSILREIAAAYKRGLQDAVVRTAKGDRLAFNNLLAIATPGETDRTFPRDSKVEGARYRRLTFGRKTGQGVGTTTNMVLEAARSQEMLGHLNRSDIFLESVAAVLPIERIGFVTRRGDPSHGRRLISLGQIIRISDLNGREAQEEIDRSKDPFFIAGDSLVPLSSGQISFLSVAAQLARYINVGSLVLLDEPETHLHPSLVSALITMLERVLAMASARAILATHSPFLIRELPKNQVLVFKREKEGEVSVTQSAFQTRGADIGLISFFVFDQQSFGEHVEQVISEYEKSFEEGRKFDASQYGSDFSPEALMYLKSRLARNSR